MNRQVTAPAPATTTDSCPKSGHRIVSEDGTVVYSLVANADDIPRGPYAKTMIIDVP